MAKVGEQVEKAIFEPALSGTIDAGIIGFSTAAAMLWNSLQGEKRIMWAFGELIVAVLIGSSLRQSRVRDIVFGIESGAIGTLLAPLLAEAQKQTGGTGARAVSAPATRTVHPAPAMLYSYTPPQKGVGSTAQPVPRGVSVLDI